MGERVSEECALSVLFAETGRKDGRELWYWLTKRRVNEEPRRWWLAWWISRSSTVPLSMRACCVNTKLSFTRRANVCNEVLFSDSPVRRKNREGFASGSHGFFLRSPT